MASRAREAVAPVYLLLCLIAGGSAQGIWANMVLQLIGIALIAWAATARNVPVLAPPARWLFGIILAGLALIALQLISLPATVWPALGGRDGLARGYALLGMAIPPLPVSLAPYDTLSALVTLLPPLGMLCAIVRLHAYRASWLAAALIAGTFCGILLGILQVSSGDPERSSWYLFDDANFGVATGFFANANHMATLLVVSLPFLAALVAAGRRLSGQRYSALLAVCAGAAFVVVIGIILNQSMAGYLLALPVLAASAAIVMPPASRFRGVAILLSVVGLAAAFGGLELSSIRAQAFNARTATSVHSREAILKTTVAATQNFLPFGSGVGTFRHVYDLYEDPNRVTPTYVVHAHNDYAELALETGLPGVVIVFVFLLWWGAAVRRAWRLADAGPYVRAASVASAAILVHSLVDFPLRTAAIGTVFAMCLALLADRRAPLASVKSDLRPTRHIVLK